MSAPDEASVRGMGVGPESGVRASVRQRPRRGLEVRAPQSGEGEGGLLVREGLQAEREVMEATETVLWGRESRPGSPADEVEDALDYTSHLAEESATVVEQMTDQDTLEVQRNPSPKSCTFQMSSIWEVLEESPNGRSAPPPSCEESEQASPVPLNLNEIEESCAWENPKRGPKNQLNIPVDLQRHLAEGIVGQPFDSESLDEFSEMQLMRENIYAQEEGQGKSSILDDPGDTLRPLNAHVRENVFRLPASFLTYTSHGFTSSVEWQPIGELQLSLSKKMQGVVCEKRGRRPNYPGSAAASSLPQATPRKKVAQEKRSLGGASKDVVDRKPHTFPSWGQRTSRSTLEPATFPPIFGVPLLGRSKRYSLVPSGSKQPKHRNAGKKPVACRTRESMPTVQEDNNPNRDPVPKGQLPANRPGPSCLSMHRGEGSHGHLKTRGPQVLGLQPLTLSQACINPRVPTPLGHQAPLVLPPRQERQQQPPGAQGCPGCLVLQKEIDDLKHQLAVMQSLTEKFQTL
ncbi:uncharacterized protein CXorf49 homolog [Tamandua tetradactyla]|uniref:uncharacterized protein CXorf49 homolog n=1 Tax=Tamandua tetradactyla TaxID=48850 RepID=UPI00405476D9